MPLTVLNNISSLTAENSLSNTQMNLQKTLTQLSTGLKINSGSDDAAGLSIANGMQANIAALTQSQQNANNGVGLLQTADGALSQVTTLLNRAVTLATEGSTSGVTGTQATALDTEFQSILSEVNQIGQATNFNGANVFASNAPTNFTSTQGTLSATTALAANSTVTINDSTTGGTFVFNAGATGSTVGALNTAIAGALFRPPSAGRSLVATKSLQTLTLPRVSTSPPMLVHWDRWSLPRPATQALYTSVMAPLQALPTPPSPLPSMHFPLTHWASPPIT
jgi:flagellin